jgi:MFS transporter, DHA1 family, tetracycline resistance protein
MQRARVAGVGFIFVTMLLDTLGIGLVIPVLPTLVSQLSGGEVAEGSRTYGLFVSAYAAMQILAAPLLGALGDRFGRRPVLLASLFFAALDYVLLCVAPSLAWLFVGRVIAGLTGASFSTAQAYIADVMPPERRAQSFGLVGAAFGAGFVLGPVIGGLLGDLHLRAPFAVAAGMNALNFLYGLLVLPESLAKEHRRALDWRNLNPVGALAVLRRSPFLRALSGTIVCAYLAQQMLQSVWALSTQQRFSWGPFEVGTSLAVVGVASGLVQGGLVRLVVPKLGERRTLLVALCFSVLGFLGFAWAPTGTWMNLTILPFALGGLAGPATQALLTREVGVDEQGGLQGALASLNSLCAVVAPLVGTRLLATFSSAHAR